jgi:hypothetical protein
MLPSFGDGTPRPSDSASLAFLVTYAPRSADDVGAKVHALHGCGTQHELQPGTDVPRYAWMGSPPPLHANVSMKVK